MCFNVLIITQDVVHVAKYPLQSEHSWPDFKDSAMRVQLPLELFLSLMTFNYGTSGIFINIILNLILMKDNCIIVKIYIVKHLNPLTVEQAWCKSYYFSLWLVLKRYIPFKHQVHF